MVSKFYHKDKLTGLYWFEYKKLVTAKIPAARLFYVDFNKYKIGVYNSTIDNSIITISKIRKSSESAWKSAYLELIKQYGNEN